MAGIKMGFSVRPGVKVLAAFMLLACAQGCHVGRYVVYNFANYDDYKKFPQRLIEAPKETFYFSQRPNPVKLSIDPEKTGYDSFEDLLHQNKSISFMVIRNDTILYEWYEEDFDTSSIVTTFSMVKSFIGLMIGMAEEEGHIQSINDPITKYIPELEAGEFSKITIAHVLDMESGIASNESYYNPFAHVAKLYYGRKLNHYIAKLKVEGPPGQRFQYKSVNTQILGLILERATGSKPGEYMEEKLWQRMGMANDGIWSIDSKKHNTEKAFCCLNARTADLAKFGRLMLNEGSWNGQQLVPESWIEEIWRATRNGNDYKYQWWLEGKDMVVAQGILGQYLCIVPSKKLIIVRMGRKWGDANWISLIHSLSKKL